MSSVSMSGGCSAALFSSLQPRATDADRSQKLFSKLDVDGDGAISASELATFADDIGSRTGVKIDADSLLKAVDSDGNGSVSSTELSENGRKLFDQLREQLMGTQFEAGMQHAPGRGERPSAQGDGIGRLVASLIEQYASGASGSVAASTLGVSA